MISGVSKSSVMITWYFVSFHYFLWYCSYFVSVTCYLLVVRFMLIVLYSQEMLIMVVPISLQLKNVRVKALLKWLIGTQVSLPLYWHFFCFVLYAGFLYLVLKCWELCKCFCSEHRVEEWEGHVEYAWTFDTLLILWPTWNAGWRNMRNHYKISLIKCLKSK